MGWQVAVVSDPESNLDSLRIALGQMPVWALTTPERQNALGELNHEFRLFWFPETAFTIFSASFPDDPLASLIDVIPTIAEHHPRFSGLHLFGVESSPRLRSSLAEFGFEAVPDPDSVYPDRCRFAKPLDCISEVPEIVLDARKWVSSEDFYTAFFAAVGAPEWHGRSFNALNDSIGTGGINKIELPYQIVVRNASGMGNEAAALVTNLRDLIQQLHADGCPVGLLVQDM